MTIPRPRFIVQLVFRNSRHILAVIMLSYPVILAGAAKGEGLPAFPGAEGFGANTVHGRGGKILYVTNLNDSGAGSFRSAIETEGPRIILFKVGGRIPLKKPLSISHPFCMIAGQTAPGDGICLSEDYISVATHDVVVRFIRSRPGDRKGGHSPGNRDGFGVATKSRPPFNIVFDHCSTSWAIDENIQTWYPCHDITVQWCISAEALDRSLHPKGRHSKGFLVGDHTHNLSIHHNLFAHNDRRNPLLKADSSADIVNNVVYNWGGAAVHLSNHEKTNKPIFANLIGNYFKKGPNSKSKELYIPENIPKTSKLFLKGNIGPSRPSADSDEWAIANREEGYRASASQSTYTVKAWPAEDAFKKVLAGAGARLPNLDVVDQRVIKDVIQGAGQVIDRVDQTPGFPEYKSAAGPGDTDADGMPDVWEKEKGLNPVDPSDGSRDRNGDGYTNVEEYLNSLVDPALFGVADPGGKKD